MSTPSNTWAALAQALRPPAGSPEAFDDLRLPTPDGGKLGREHAALFGRAGRAVLSPYEGAHRNTGMHEILATYARFGFAPDPGFRDRPDHVCAELAVAGALAELAEDTSAPPETARRARDWSRRYLDLRIWPWVPGFFERMATLDEFQHHRALARRAGRFFEERGAPPAERPQECEPATPTCARCGSPVGFVPPRGGRTLPPWGDLCPSCRFRVDLRRLGS